MLLSEHVSDDEVLEDGELLGLSRVLPFNSHRWRPHLKIFAHIRVERQVLLDCVAVVLLRYEKHSLVELELMLALYLREDRAALLHEHLAPVVLLDS